MPFRLFLAYQERAGRRRVGRQNASARAEWEQKIAALKAQGG